MFWHHTIHFFGGGLALTCTSSSKMAAFVARATITTRSASDILAAPPLPPPPLPRPPAAGGITLSMGRTPQRQPLMRRSRLLGHGRRLESG